MILLLLWPWFHRYIDDYLCSFSLKSQLETKMLVFSDDDTLRTINIWLIFMRVRQLFSFYNLLRANCCDISTLVTSKTVLGCRKIGTCASGQFYCLTALRDLWCIIIIAAKSTAQLSAYLGRPVLSWYAHDVEFMNKTRFPTLVRTFPPMHKTVRPLLKLLSMYKWSNIGKFEVSARLM